MKKHIVGQDVDEHPITTLGRRILNGEKINVIGFSALIDKKDFMKTGLLSDLQETGGE